LSSKPRIFGKATKPCSPTATEVSETGGPTRAKGFRVATTTGLIVGKKPQPKEIPMDWSTVAMFTVASLVLLVMFLIWIVYSIAMRIVRLFTRTTKKTVHVIRSPFPRNR
jgi:hypothetical protein